MGLKQNFVLSRIQNQGKFLGKLILGKDEINYQLPMYEEMDNEIDKLYRRILALSEQGYVNEAENELLEELEDGDFRMFEMALSFYLHLAELGADFLEEHNYSMEEVAEGMESLAEDFGVKGLEINAGTR